MILRIYEEPPDKAGRRRICEAQPGEHGDAVEARVLAFSDAANRALAADIMARPAAFAVTITEPAKEGDPYTATLWENTAWLPAAEPGEPPVKQPAPKWVERSITPAVDVRQAISEARTLEELKVALGGLVDKTEAAQAVSERSER